MTMSAPAAMPETKGLRSSCRSCGSVLSTVAAPLCESVAVLPWPGKCFRQQMTPASRKPLTAAATSVAASS